MEKLYKAISEVADEIKIPSHVIRFWETKFSIIAPIKRAGGRRFYSEDDVLILKKIKELLYEHSYSIKSIQDAINNRDFINLVKQTENSNDDEGLSEDKINPPVALKNSFDVDKIITDLEDIKTKLNNLL